MKKLVTGILIGITISMTGTAFAASSLIGKKVEGEVKITVDNKTIDSGIIVDGKSYAPVRSITTATGLNLSYKDGSVSIKTKAAPTEEIRLLRVRKIELEGKIESTKKNIEKATLRISESKEILESATSTESEKYTAQRVYDSFTEFLKEEQANIVKYEAELAEVEKQLAALEAK